MYSIIIKIVLKLSYKQSVKRDFRFSGMLRSVDR
jgi:hypothetical protein